MGWNSEGVKALKCVFCCVIENELGGVPGEHSLPEEAVLCESGECEFLFVSKNGAEEVLNGVKSSPASS